MECPWWFGPCTGVKAIEAGVSGDCPMINQLCAAEAAVDVAKTDVEVIQSAIVAGDKGVDAAAVAVHRADQAGDLLTGGGGLLGLAVIFILLWCVGLFFAGAKVVKMSVGPAVAAGKGALRAYTGIDIDEERKKSSRQHAKKAGEAAANRQRAKRASTRICDGTGPKVIGRTNSKQGSPTALTICAANDAEAGATLRRRFRGLTFVDSGTTPCANGNGGHFSYRRKVRK